jgi:GDP-6-deoxy-D-talose 4-dehydrogenase
MKTALITGIDGFTGRYVAAELRQAGFHVVGISPHTIVTSPDTIICDICDPVALTQSICELKPDVVCHLAAIAFVAHGDVENIYRTNVVGTRNLLDALSKVGTAQSVVLASSSNIYGNSPSEILDEHTPPSPANDYAISKLAVEYVAKLWMDKLPITIVRPFNYTGVGQSLLFVVPKIVDHFIRRAECIELGNLDVVRDFSDVRTVAYCYRRLVETAPARGLSGEVFNTCSGAGVSLHDILQMMRQISGHDMEIRVNPAFVRSNEVKTLIGSRAKLEAAIGAVQDIPLYETLKWMYYAPKPT